MDFAQLHKGATALVAGVVASINLAVIPAPSPSPLTTPEVSDSFNLSSEVKELDSSNQAINALNLVSSNDLNLKMVVKEVKASETVTVEEPPKVYTVVEPTPKPTPVSDKEDSKEKNTTQKEDKKETPTTASPSPTPSATPSPSPSSSPSSSPIASGNSNSEAMFQMANEYRAKLGLKAFEKDERICKIAQSRAPQVNSELQSGTLHKGFKDLNLPYWATENIAAYSTIQDNFKFWISDYIHKKALESENKYSCVACSGASCSQIFTSFTAK